MIPLPEPRSSSHTSARSRYSRTRIVTLCSQRDEHAVNQQVTSSVATESGGGGVQGESRREPLRSLRQQAYLPPPLPCPTPPRELERGAGCSASKKRHGKVELRSLTHFAVDPQAAAMHLDEMLGDGQTETRASGFARAGDINTVEAFKNARLVRLRDADAGI